MTEKTPLRNELICVEVVKSCIMMRGMSKKKVHIGINQLKSKHHESCKYNIEYVMHQPDQL